MSELEETENIPSIDRYGTDGTNGKFNVITINSRENRPVLQDQVFNIQNSSTEDDNSETGIPNNDPSTSVDSVTEDLELIGDSKRWIIGYTEKGIKHGQLIVKVNNMSSRIYDLISGSKNEYKCKCLKIIKVESVDGKMRIREDDFVHQCKTTPLRMAFFAMKKWALIYGTINEIKQFEAVTERKCDEVGFIKVDQRDWIYGEKDETTEIVMVRNNNMNNDQGYKYVRRFDETNDEEKVLFACSRCTSENKAVLIKYNNNYDIPVIFKQKDDKHSCEAIDFGTMFKNYGKHIDELDALRLVAKNDWMLGYNSNGLKNGRVMIKNPNNEKLCKEYYKSSTRKFHCIKCRKQAVFYLENVHGESRVVCPTYICCPYYSFDEAMENQELYKVLRCDRVVDSERSRRQSNPMNYSSTRITNGTSNFLVDESVIFGSSFNSDIPVVPSGKFRVLDDGILLYYNKEKELGFKYVPTESSNGDDQNVYKCICCSSEAYVEKKGHTNTIIRSHSKHDAECRPLSTYNPIFHQKRKNNRQESTKSQVSKKKKKIANNKETSDQSTANLSETSKSMSRTVHNIPIIDITRVKIFNNKKNIVIAHHENDQLLYRYEETKRKDSKAVDYKCINCSETAYLRVSKDDKKKTTIRSSFEHVCQPLTLDDIKSLRLECDMPQSNQTQYEGQIDYLETLLSQFGSNSQKEKATNRESNGYENITVPLVIETNKPINIAQPELPSLYIKPENYDDDDIQIIEEFGMDEEEEVESIIRPSNQWINTACKYFGIKGSVSDAYRVWARLRDINYKKSTTVPRMNGEKNIIRFKSGFDLLSHLLTGKNDFALAIKEKLNAYILKEYKTFGVIDNTNYASLTTEHLGSIMFNDRIQPAHLYSLSKILNCTVVVYNYSTLKKPEVFNHGDDATIIMGSDNHGLFIFI